MKTETIQLLHPVGLVGKKRKTHISHPTMRKGATTPSRSRQDVKLKRSKNELGEHVKKLNAMPSQDDINDMASGISMPPSREKATPMQILEDKFAVVDHISAHGNMLWSR
jgi:hypothetical protein